MWLAVFPEATLDPAIEAPRADSYARDHALVEIVRGRLDALGPTTAASLAGTLGVPVEDIDAALLALEAEGTAMRGRFTESAAGESPEWCNRRLLARIHRYTVNRLRREIEPVEQRDFLRFLFEWQRVAPEARVEGTDAVAGIVAQLEGFEAPAAAWETEILPARVNEYDPASLDELSRAGRVVWTRIAPLQASGGRAPAPVRTTPIVLAQRRNLAAWNALAAERDNVQLGSGARKVFAYLDAHGASFFDDIVEGCGLLRAQLEEALAELVANGLAVADSFAGLRALLVPSERRRPAAGRRRPRRTALFGIEDAGRWSLTRRRPTMPQGEPVQAATSERSPTRSPGAPAPAQRATPDVVEHVARGLLRRYGVVFWHLVAREARWLPPWRELLRCYRRLEARGEIRGGRFVAGLSGEQFAAPEAIGSLREIRRRERDGMLIGLSGADPLNLVGVLSPGARVPSLTGNRVLYRDGIPIAVLVAGEVRYLEPLSGPDQWAARDALLRRHVPASLQLLG